MVKRERASPCAHRIPALGPRIPFGQPAGGLTVPLEEFGWIEARVPCGALGLAENG
jgi:hypothetical protein